MKSDEHIWGTVGTWNATVSTGHGITEASRCRKGRERRMAYKIFLKLGRLGWRQERNDVGICRNSICGNMGSNTFLYNWPWVFRLTCPVLVDVVGDVVNPNFSIFFSYYVNFDVVNPNFLFT